jgi:CheY-like chemotaxis protein
MRQVLDAEGWAPTVVQGGGDEACRQTVLASSPEALVVDECDVLLRLREDERPARMPAVVCTASGIDWEDVQSLLRDQPNVEILRKPFSMEQLSEAIRQLRVDH